MPSYLAWPTWDDVKARLSSAGITLRTAAPGRFDKVLNDVTTVVYRKTLRQFIADTVDTTRQYDGTDTAAMEVDEMVSLTRVDVIGIQVNPGYTLSNTVLVHEFGKPQTRIVIGPGSLPALLTSGVIYPLPMIFPAGRQNISVTGKFGYAATIPADLWNAVEGQVALELGQEAIFRPNGGLVIERAEGDSKIKFAEGGIYALRWGTKFGEALVTYKRPSGRRLRNLRNRMT